ncbi:polymer-forming cytoskeletal protein [Pseudoalteromonas aurantia]|uniref:Right handed beta helix domain-containing protein n=1 Tax=Pseudoalteromonas aurantia 208 TaxID=1314867 RepID=A0ABR9EH71_9GAMM|nr:polymer-forming cytoskeletal protein [Pseudoalteromonas aurantia]MBE0370331.1 hypothetical protein [Pseudoalteromonas aurantia 208]
MTTSTEQDIESSTESSTPAPESRASLIGKFDDLQTPTGDDFESLIRSSFNQVDDPLKVTGAGDDETLEVTAPLNIKRKDLAPGSTAPSANITITPEQLIVAGADAEATMVKVTADAVSVGENGNFTASANTLNAYNVLEVNADTSMVKVTGDIKTQSLTSESAHMTTVQADQVNTEKLIVTTNTTLGPNTTAEQLSVSGATTLKDSLAVTGATNLEGNLIANSAIFNQHLEAHKALGVGINKDSTKAILHINKSSSDMDALLRVDDENNDDTPFIIDSEGKVGINTSMPDSHLHVDGSFLVGVSKDSATVHLKNDGPSQFNNEVQIAQGLAVQGGVSVGTSLGAVAQGNAAISGKIGLGTHQPEALLDIHAAQPGSMLNMQNGDDKYIKVTSAPVTDETEITLYKPTKIAQDLYVSGRATSQTSVVEGSLTAQNTEVETLHVSDSATVSGLTQSKTLLVGEQSGTTEPERAAGALINAPLTVKHSAQFQDITAATTLQATDAVIRERLNVGHAQGQSNARVSINAQGADETTLLIKDDEDKALLRVKKQKVTLGSEGGSLPLCVEGSMHATGKVSAPSLDISGHVNANTSLVNEQIKVAALSYAHGFTTSAKFAVLADEMTTSGIDVSYKNGNATTSVLVNKAEYVGVHKADPQVHFHVGSESMFEGHVTLRNTLEITQSENSLPAFRASLTQTQVGSDATDAQFMVYGDTELRGAFSVFSDDGNFIRTNDSQLQLTQLGVEPVFKISDETNAQVIYAQPGKLAINQTIDMNSADFSLTGEAKITGTLAIENPELALQVKGRTDIEDKLQVIGETALRNGLDVSVTNNTAEAAKDALSVSGSSVLNGTLTVSEATDIADTLTVGKLAQFNDALTVTAHTQLNDTVTVEGVLVAQSNVVIKGEVGDNALTVDNKAVFRDDVSIGGDLSLTPYEASARVHICEQQAQALRIDHHNGEVGLVFSQGNLGLGLERPEYMLDVAEDSRFHKDLTVSGRVEIDDSLHVNEYASFRSNLNVYGNTELLGEARVGLAFHHQQDDSSSARLGNAQLSIEQNHFDKALAVYHQGSDPVVVKEGRLGIGTEDPRAHLDVTGNVTVTGDIELDGVLKGAGRLECLDGAKIFGDVELRSDLTVSDDVLLKDSLTVEGHAVFTRKVRVEGDSDFVKNVAVAESLTVEKRTSLKDNLHVGKHATIQGGVNIEGLEADSKVLIKPDTALMGCLQVNGPAEFNTTLSTRSLSAQDTLNIGDTRASAKLAINSEEGLAGLDIAISGDTQLHLNCEGQLGLGTAQASHKLDVNGDARISEALSVEGRLEVGNGAQIAGDCQIQGALSADDLSIAAVNLPNSPTINMVSQDPLLGGEQTSNNTLATQSAVKAYIDEHTWQLSHGKKVIAIHDQQEFDAVFERGTLNNVTILLYPHNSHPQVTRAYKLNQAVEIGSNVSIVGFNEQETRIVKAHPGCRFILRGERDAKVKNVQMKGFTFDGTIAGEPSRFEGSGGAFSLRYVENIQLNCVIEHHCVSHDGGAIYGDVEATEVQALNIRQCKAGRQGGAAYGLKYSTIDAQFCQAERGGAVAHCDNSEVLAKHNSASLYGGGAYKCENLMCTGHWRNNRANGGEGQHIYSAGCEHGELHEQPHQEGYLWHAVYLDHALTCAHGYWRNDHI